MRWRRAQGLRGPRESGGGWGWILRAVLLAHLVAVLPTLGVALARLQVPLDFTPAGGHAQVIAQGVVDLPNAEMAWRTVRYQAESSSDAPFAGQSLGFVLAISAPVLLVDQATRGQTRLGPGEAALVRDGTIQQRASLAGEPASYLGLELVPAATVADADTGAVLQEGQPFIPTPGLHDLDLVRDILTGDEVLTMPDTGESNVILVTEGAISVGRPGEEPTTQLAGEMVTFDGELEVKVAGAGEGEAEASAQERGAFVAAVIGPEVAPVVPLTPDSGIPTSVPSVASMGIGSVTILVANCPPGMQPASLIVADCGVASDDFDVTLSGDALRTTLTLADAAKRENTYTWDNLPYGRYLLAEAVLPQGYDAYIVSAAAATGEPETGYTITVDATTPDILLTIYNFVAEPSSG